MTRMPYVYITDICMYTVICNGLMVIIYALIPYVLMIYVYTK